MSLFFASGQNTTKKKLSFEEIEKEIDASQNKSKELWNYINLYIKQSKEESNPETLLYAYRYASNFSSSPNNIKYADSALSVSIKSNDKKLMTKAYTNIGIIYMKEYSYQKALDNIIIANKYSTELGDLYEINKTKYFIAQNKIYLGLYEEANEELVSCIEYFKNNLHNKSLGKDFEVYYLFSLISYIDSNTKLRKQKENVKLIQEGLDYVNRNNLKQYRPYFISSQGMDAYYLSDYQLAIDKLNLALKTYDDQWTHLTESYYLGLSYWEVGQKDLAITHLLKIDEEYNKTKKLEPQFRSVYEILIKHFESIGDRDKQLEYIEKLMTLDDSYEKNYKYLYNKINKEYDTKKLLEEKNKIEKNLRTEKQIYALLFIMSILAGGYVYYRFYRMKKVYEERFNKIMNESNSKIVQPKPIEIAVEKEKTEHLPDLKNPEELDYFNKIPGINPNSVQTILNQLNQFELEEEFLNPQLSLKSLSETFSTNSTYLSKIINVYKEKNFNAYVNDLRMDYIVELMKNDWTILNKDIKELAQIAGFTSAESFSDNFQRKFEIKPSYFIKRLKENIKVT